MGSAFRPDVCPQSLFVGCSDPELLASLFMLSLERILLVGGADSQIECLSQPITGAAAEERMRDYLPFSLG